MALAKVIAYGVVFGLPLWLLSEELLQRIGPYLKAASLRVRLDHRGPENAPEPAHVPG